jgi:DNA-binding beta-propeller fold protein YncE
MFAQIPGQRSARWRAHKAPLKPWVTYLLGASALGCFPPDDGLAPDPDGINFPVGLALSNGGDRLYVANSDFDLRYNGGVLQVFDAEVLRGALPTFCERDAECPDGTCGEAGEGVQGVCVDSSGSACGGLGDQTGAERFSHPGPCKPLVVAEAGLLESATIAPFVADLRYVAGSESGDRNARLMMPVRGDATLHWADVEDDVQGTGPVLDCGQDASGACDDDHRRGDQASEASVQGDKLPTEPFGIAVSADGRAVFVGHQSQGSVSVFRNTNNGPALRSVLSGLPSNPMGLAFVPPPRAAEIASANYQPGVLVSYRLSGRTEPAVELLRYFDADAADPGAPYLHRGGSSPITTNSVGSDSRGIAVDDTARAACEATCSAESCAADDAAPDCVECLLDCAAVPVDAFMANRSPDSLLIGQTRPVLGDLSRDDLPNFSDAVPLRGAPSRITVASVIDEAGQPSRRVFVLGFDARLLYVYDPARRELEAHVETGPGPHSLVVDEQRGIGYIAHFTDSYVGLIDLDKRHATYGRVLLNVGEPRPPRSSK